MRLRLSALAVSVGLALSLNAAAYTNERGLDARNFDTNAKPCVDFYQYANGGWLASNPIPPEYSTWGIGSELRERNLNVLKDILEDSAKEKHAAGSSAQKIGDFYAAAMDEAAIEKAGAAPLKPYLSKIDALKTNEDVVTLIRDWHAQGLQTLFSFGALSDLKDSSKVIAYATQDGLGLPEREYYLKDDAESKALRDKYVAHVEKMLTLAGVAPADAKQQAQWILALETRLAKASLDQVAMRDPANYYNIVTLEKADAHTPHMSWSKYFDALGVEQPTFSLAQPGFFTEADKMLAELPTSHWQAYLRWNVVDFAAPNSNAP